MGKGRHSGSWLVLADKRQIAPKGFSYCYLPNGAIFNDLERLLKIVPVTFTYLIGESRPFRRMVRFSLLRLINTLTCLLTYLMTSFLLIRGSALKLQCCN